MLYWEIGGLFLAAVGWSAGWLTAKVLQSRPTALWLDALLGPIAFVVVAFVTSFYAPGAHNLKGYGPLNAAWIVPIVHQAINRVRSELG